MAEPNQIILSVKLDEGKTEEQLKQLVLDIEKTREAMSALASARLKGKVNDEDYAAGVVRLRAQLKGQQTEQTALTKNLELYRTATGELGNSYTGMQAQLSLAQRQFQQLDGSADNSSESAKELTKTIDTLRNTLKATDAQQSLFARNIGNYPDGKNLESLVKQLVELQEQSKKLTAGTEEAARAQMRIIGFQTQAAQAGAKEGKTYEETTSFIKEYSEAIRPATAALVELVEQQKEVAESGEDAGEKMQQIGFKIGKAQEALKKAEAQAKETGPSIGDALGQASEAAEVLGVDVGGLESGFSRAKKGIDIAKSAFGSLRGAILAVPIFALLAALTALVAYFTKTREGAALLETTMAKVGAVVDVIIDRAGILGKAIAQLFSGDFKAAAETARKSYQGIGDEMEREIKLAGDLSKERQQLERDEISNIATNKTLLNQVERLKNVRDNEFNSIQTRKKANEEAYQIELKREKTLADLAQRKVDLLKAEADRRGGLTKLDNDAYRAYQEAENELADIREDAAGKQNELITNRYQLEQERIDKSIELRAQAFALEAAQLNKQLAQVRVNSDEELNLLQRKLRNGYQAELNVKNLTMKQKLAIDTKYEQDSLALSLDFNRRRLQAALQATLDTTAAQLSAEQQGSADSLRLQEQQIENQRRLSIEALAANTDNTARINAINAQAEQQRRQAEYAEAVRLLQEYLNKKKQVVENDYAGGLIKEAEYRRRLAEINKSGTDAQAVINSDYRQSNAENQRQADENETEARRQNTADVKQQEEVKRQIKASTVQAAEQYTDAIITLFGKESEAGKAALALKKILAIAEIGMSLEKQIAANAEAGTKISAIAPPVTTPLGVAYTVAADALAITAAAASVATILKLRKGGIAYGPTHEEGGIPLTYQGRFAGIEIEGGEPVLTAAVSKSPLLLSMASLVNEAAGGRPLAPALRPFPQLALGGVTPLMREQLRGQITPNNAAEIGKTVAAELRKNPPVIRWVDFKSAEKRNDYTQTQASA